MQRAQANRARIAGRTTTRNPRNPGPVSTDPAARTLTTVPPRVGAVRKTRAKMTGAQRNSQGRRSEWSASPYFFTDPAWSRTVRDAG